MSRFIAALIAAAAFTLHMPTVISPVGATARTHPRTISTVPSISKASVMTMDLETLKVVVEITTNLFTLLAILVGAAWAYFHDFRGRTYKPRIELDVSGEVVVVDGIYYLLATLKLK